MNWYKQAKYDFPPISILSYDGYGDLSISFNGGKKYVYPDVSPFYKDKIDFLLRKKNYKAVDVLLRNLSRTSKKDPQIATEPTPEPPKKPQQGLLPFMQ